MRTTGLGAIVAVAMCMVGGPAAATPPVDISAVTVADIAVPADLVPLTSGIGRYVAREITIAPGGSTGWHYHAGYVAGVVRQGELSHPGPDCVPVIYPAGSHIFEPGGIGNVHEGNNTGTVPVILDVIYAVPPGGELFTDAPAPACASH